MRKTVCILLILLGFLISSCREEVEIYPPVKIPVSTPQFSSIQGFYLLNEGNMGSNKSTLDYYEYETGTYHRNIFASANPSVPKELGDVGNDLQIYGSRLYAVINCSNKIEVMDATTAKRLGQIELPNCRYIKFHEGFAYITSYAGPVQIKPTYEQLGYVAKVDTATLQVVDRCIVGFQPDELEIMNGKIYVANSGGYMFPNYENTVSVIDINTFKEIKRIEVAINLHRIRGDKYGNIWVGSRGNYHQVPSRLYCIDSEKELLVDSLDIPVSNFHVDGDSLYLISVEWSYLTMQNETRYGIVNVADRQIVTTKFITDGTDAEIEKPYGIMVNPITKDIYISDARSYITPGNLYCFNRKGEKRWKIRTGDIPANFAFLGELNN